MTTTATPTANQAIPGKQKQTGNNRIRPKQESNSNKKNPIKSKNENYNQSINENNKNDSSNSKTIETSNRNASAGLNIDCKTDENRKRHSHNPDVVLYNFGTFASPAVYDEFEQNVDSADDEIIYFDSDGGIIDDADNHVDDQQ